MTRSIIFFCLSGVVLNLTACAQSLHQTDRLASVTHPADTGYADAPSYWSGPGQWWNSFGYYGSGFGWYGGGHRGANQSSTQSAPRPTPPANAPPQFKKSS